MNRHPLRKKLPLIVTLTLLALAVAGYVLGLAWFQSRNNPYYEFEDLIEPRLIDATIASWLIYFCSSIGSFLNVVAWRMPRGEGIGGRSHCPRCASTLLTRDNVPVLGWISLRGRCRFCSLPISRRYPIVEALVGVTLTLVGIAQIYSLSLPGQNVHGHGGPLWAPSVSTTLLAILSYHAVAISTLWAMALIRIDGTKLPRKLLAFSAVALIVPMLAYPTVMIVPWQANRPPGWYPDGLYVDAIMRAATALVAAAFFGRVLAKGLCPSADLKLNPLGKSTARLVDLIAMLSIPALVIGWQAMPALVILATILTFVLRPLLNQIPINDGPKGQIATRGMMESFAFALPPALVIHVVFWRVLWQSPYWPGDMSAPAVMITWAVLALLVPLVVRESRPPESQPAETRTAESPSAPLAADSPVSTDELPTDHGDAEPDDRDQRGDDAPGP